MTNLPEIRSKEQITGELIDGFLARVKDVDDLTQASVINQFFNAVAQSNFKAAADIITMIDALSVDRARGEALQRLAADANVVPDPGSFSSGRVNITDISFSRVLTSVFAGQPAPVAGSTKIFVVSAEDMVAGGGQIYIGRGTPNVEGPLTYTTVTSESGGAYWSITLDVTSPTTKFHNIGEKVIMAQGGTRQISSGTTVRTSAGSGVSSVDFTTTASATILDGETTVSNVPVASTVLGKGGNVPRGSIREAVGLPFEVVVFNPNAFVDGTPPDSDEVIRTKIKEAEQAKAKGTEQAIKAAAIGVTSTDDLKKVKSSSILRDADLSTTLVFDDGGIYESIYSGVGVEQVLDGALGGEKELQLRKRPVTIARLKTINSGPFNIPDGWGLSVTIQGENSIHYFDADDFRVPSSGTAFEVMSSINGNPNIHFSATTGDSESTIVLYPRDKSKNDIKVERLTTDDANDLLGFPLSIQYSLLLYKNDKLLFQDGLPASILTRLKSSWSTSIAEGDTLIYSVDGTPDITVTFTKESFQKFDITAIVSSFTSIELWAEVFNLLLTGVVTSVSGEQLVCSSARGESNDASFEIKGGTIQDKIFEVGVSLYVEGSFSDYTLNKETGQVGLSTGLATGDAISAGSSFTRANIVTDQIPDGPSSDGNIWMVVDGSAKIFASGLEGNTLTQFSKTGSKITITSQDPNTDPVGYDDVMEGDWVLAWPEQIDATNYPGLFEYQGFWRVESVKRGEITVEEDVNIVRGAAGFETLPTDRIVIVRSLSNIQKLSFTTGPLSGLISEIEEQIEGVSSDIVGSTVRFSTLSSGENGEIAILAADSQGKSLGIAPPIIEKNIPSQKAFVLTEDSEVGMPTFGHSTLDDFITDVSFTEPLYEELKGGPGDFIEILNRYDISGEDLKPLQDSNKNRRIFVKEYDESTDIIDLEPKGFSRSDSSQLKENDRYYVRTGYQFDSTDKTVVVIDGDVITKTYNLAVARKLIVNGITPPTTADFSADDGESSLALNDSASFAGFSFDDWKAWRQAAALLSDGSTYGLRVKSADYGPAGDTIRAGLVYPKDINTDAIGLVLNNAEMIDIGIEIPVTTVRLANWNGTTSFTVDVVPVGVGKDSVTYTWRVGSEPDFLDVATAVAVGDLVILNSGSDFLPQNKDIEAKVTNVTSTTFTIEISSGIAISDNQTILYGNNNSGVYKIDTPTPHGLLQGDRVGIWGTELVDGITAPIDGVYFITWISDTEFSIQLDSNVPGGDIAVASWGNNVATLFTATPHGLSVGNIIIIRNSDPAINGVHSVIAVSDPNSFSVGGDIATTGSSTSGTFDFQSTKLVDSAAVTDSTSALDTHTFNVIGHTFADNDFVDIAGVIIDDWVSGTQYINGALVTYSGTTYIALITTTALTDTPDINPTEWQATSFDLNGRYLVTNAVPNYFDIVFHVTQGAVTSEQTTTTTSGTVSKLVDSANLARSLGKSGDVLAFGEIGTTAQEVVDYIIAEQSDLLSAIVESPYTGAEAINTSTKDNDLATGFLSGSIAQLRTIKASRLIELTIDSSAPEGSKIQVSGVTGYDGEYTVFSQRETVIGVEWKIMLQSDTYAIGSATTAVVGTFVGSTDYLALRDGEAFIKNTDLAALAPNPQFELKASKTWDLPPTIGEEIRLIAINTEHLTDYWNRLSVTGLSNVAEVANSEYGRQVQLTTNTFGSGGSVQFTGGAASSMNVAMVGSGSELNGKVGVFNIPYDLRRGLSRKSWIKLSQIVKLNKEIGFDQDTVLTVHADGIEIKTGYPQSSFQTKRVVTHDETSIFNIEKHGKFVAFLNVGGTSIGLGTAGVKEGDWVRLKNTQAASVYDAVTNWVAGDRVFSSGLNWTCVGANGPASTVVNPLPTTNWDVDTPYSLNDVVRFNDKAYKSTDTSTNIGQSPSDPSASWDLIWETRELAGGNTGIFKVVRVSGESDFWIENSNAVEEIIYIGDEANISFFSYDSVMPGDELVVSGNILGATNVGRYQVLDDGSGSTFPTSTRIFTAAGLDAVGDKGLGNSSAFVNVEEQEPLSMWKQILAIGPGASGLASVIVDSPELVNKFSSSNNAFLTAQGKMEYDTVPAFGIDAYKYYGGLVKSLNQVIYGDPTDPVAYPGFRAAGTSVAIRESVIKRIEISLSVRVRTGIPFGDIREAIKASITGYVNNLKTGEQVALSRVVQAAQKINGVSSVVILYPEYDIASDQIPVGAGERAFIKDPVLDITVSILDT